MNECNSIEVTNTYSNLGDHIKFRLNEINKTKYYFNSEIQERKIIFESLVNILLLLVILASL